MLPAVLKMPIDVKQGDRLYLEIDLTDESDAPINLSGRESLMQWRASPRSAPVLELSTANGRITYGARGFVLDVPDSVMQTVSPGTYQMDLQTTTGGADTQTILSGKINVIADVAYE